MQGSTTLNAHMKIDQNNIESKIDPNQTMNEIWFKQDFQSPQDYKRFAEIS